MSDAPAIQAAFPHPDIVRYLNANIPWPYPDDGAASFLRDIALPAMAAGHEWHWSITLKSSANNLIGVISLMDRKDDNRGFWVQRAWQGKGIATEAADAVTAFWFDTLGKTRLRVPKAISNTASRRISERSGMRVIKKEQRAYVSGLHMTEVWEMTREEWQASTRR